MKFSGKKKKKTMGEEDHVPLRPSDRALEQV